MPIEQPLDHNAECKYCDEQAYHRIDCPWLLELIAQAEDLAAKLQLLVNTMDERGDLPEHVFTFPDGDTWEAQPWPK